MHTTSLPTMMRAAVLYAPRDLRLEVVPAPSLAHDDVLVAADAVGLCGSDVHFYTGERSLVGPMILGHEIVGHIIATGRDVPLERLGERVAIEPNIPCGACPRCAHGLGRICASKKIIGQTHWGGLAEYVSVPQGFAWLVPETFRLSDAAMIEPTAVVVHALSRGHMLAGETIAVIGCGGVGLLLAMVAIAQGYRVVVLEPNAIRRDAALAAGVALAWSEQDPDKLRSLLEQAGVSVIFECAGLPITAQLCIDAAPPGSCIVLVGLATENVALNPLRFVRQELEIRGTIIYDHPADFATTIELIAAGRLAPGTTTRQPQPLERVPELLEAMAAGGLDAKPIIALT